MKRIIFILTAVLLLSATTTTVFSQESEEKQTYSGDVILSVWRTDFIIEGDTTSYDDPGTIIEVRSGKISIVKRNFNLTLTYGMDIAKDEDGIGIMSAYDSKGKKYYMKIAFLPKTEEHEKYTIFHIIDSESKQQAIYYCSYLVK